MDHDSDETLRDVFGKGFERVLLWMIINDKEVGARMGRKLPVSVFSTEAKRAVFGVCSDSVKATGQPATFLMIITTLRERLRAAPKDSPAREAISESINELGRIQRSKAPSKADRELVMEKVGEYATQRNILAIIYNRLPALVEQKDWATMVAEFKDAIEEGKRVVDHDIGVEAYSDLSKKMNRYLKRRYSGRKYPTGIPKLDKVLRDGGMEAGTLGIIMGPPARGKSMGLVHFGYSALARGYLVVHVTLEIYANEVEARYDAHLTQSPINSFLSGKHDRNWAMQVQRAFVKVNKKFKGNLLIKEGKADELSVSDLYAYLDVVRSKFKRNPDLVLVDYLDLLRPQGKFKSDQNRFALNEMARDLRGLGSDFNCGVWTAMQSGRESFDSATVKMRDAAESVNPIRIADVILGFNQTAEERRRSKARFILLKNRLGGEENLQVDLLVNTNTQTIHENPIQGSNLAPNYYGNKKKGNKKP